MKAKKEKRKEDKVGKRGIGERVDTFIRRVREKESKTKRGEDDRVRRTHTDRGKERKEYVHRRGERRRERGQKRKKTRWRRREETNIKREVEQESRKGGEKKRSKGVIREKTRGEAREGEGMLRKRGSGREEM